MTPAPPRRALTRQQRAALWAAWGGWTLDGMDSFIYALVLAPAMRELLPRSGIAVTPGNVGFYGSLLFALFLVGWGLSLGWGPVADRFGRVRTLQLTILCYSLFTCLGAFTSSIWSLALCRTAAGIGIGGEWSIGSTVVAETLPEGRRAAGAGLMHTGYYVGFFIAAVLNYTVGAIRLARDVPGWWRPGAAGAVDPPQRRRARPLGSGGRAFLDRIRCGGAVCRSLSAPHGRECAASSSRLWDCGRVRSTCRRRSRKSPRAAASPDRRRHGSLRARR